MKPDYSQYSYFELVDALNSIDKYEFPEREQEIKDELDKLAKNIKEIGFRFPFMGVPSQKFLQRVDEPAVGIWQKFKRALGIQPDKPLKTYGNIEAGISEGSEGAFNMTTVAAYMVENNGFLSLVLRGQFHSDDSENYEEARIQINASNITRLRKLLDEVEKDIRYIRPVKQR